jgi:type IV pilus assembly protein PilW
MKKQFGYSLIELMIAITIGLIVLGAVSSVFLTSNQTNKTQDNLARLQENARFVLNKMETDIRMAGYRGCLGRKGRTNDLVNSPATAVTNVINGITYNDDLAFSLLGYNATGSGWFPILNTTGTPTAPSQNSDVITVRLGVGTGAQLTGAMANASADIPVASNADSLTVGDTALIADCVASTVFKVTAVSATTITHGTGANTTANLGRAFGSDATVMPVSTVTYYVAPSSDLTNGLSLWRKTNLTYEELADGVETLKILYGEDLNGDLSPDKYVTANNVTNMNNVIAIKLMLLMRTSSDNLSASGQKYTFNGVSNITPPDKRIRRSFSTVITIRNRAT